jgi:ribosomal protein S6--L-glutamate ligase
MSTEPRKIAVISSKVNSITSEMMEELTKKGLTVRLICPEKEVTDLTKLRVEDDLYIIKSVGHLGLGLAGALYAAGANLLNPYPTVALIKHKVVITQILHSTGVPVPETYTATDPQAFLPLLKKYNLIAKPFDGNRGRGIQIIRTPQELLKAQFGEFLMVQRYCQPDEPHRFIKAYYLDGQIFLIKRWWSKSKQYGKEGEPLEASPALTRIVTKCAGVLKLKLFGLDIVISRGAPYVVDVQEFGSFAGVPEAAIRLADFIYSYLHCDLLNRADRPML